MQYAKECKAPRRFHAKQGVPAVTKTRIARTSLGRMEYEVDPETGEIESA